MTLTPQPKPSAFKFSSILRARCPACHEGKVMDGFKVRPKCLVCGHNFYPEPGFYLGAMVVGFFSTAVLTVPPTIVLKVMEVDTGILVAFPLVEFIFVGSFLMIYCKILWLHLEYRISGRLSADRTKN